MTKRKTTPEVDTVKKVVKKLQSTKLTHLIKLKNHFIMDTDPNNELINYDPLPEPQQVLLISNSGPLTVFAYEIKGEYYVE